MAEYSMNPIQINIVTYILNISLIYERKNKLIKNLYSYSHDTFQITSGRQMLGTSCCRILFDILQNSFNNI